MHPFANVAIVSAFNTRQARVLDGATSLSITLEAARGALAAANLRAVDVDGVFGSLAGELIYELGIGPAFNSRATGGLAGIVSAASLIASGVCEVVLIADGGAGIYTHREATAPWTRPSNEFVACFGLYTAVEFALIARRHMHRYGTRPEDLAAVAAIIRNNGHVNPEASYFGRGPYTADDVLASRMVADPFHLLDCAMTGEGGGALVMTTAERASDLTNTPVFVLGGGADHFGPAYQHAPRWELSGRDPDLVNGTIGRRAAQQAFRMAGLQPSDVHACELYDPFSFEIIRQLEAFGFCGEGDAAAFIDEGNVSAGGRLPITTDGGTMSFSHGGGVVQMLQRGIRGVHQLQGTASGHQVVGAEVVLCSAGGAGALFNEVVLLGSAPP